MKGYSNRIVNVLFIAVVCLPILLVILCGVGALFVVGNEDKLTAKELNNPFINADYKSWHTVKLGTENTIMLPDKWNIQTTESTTVITDENGKEVAKGGYLGNDGDSADRYERLLSNLLGYPVSVATMTREASVRSSRCGTVVLSDDQAKKYYYIFLSKSGAYDMLFVFDPTANETHSNIIEILEAMIFSYVWK